MKEDVQRALLLATEILHYLLEAQPLFIVQLLQASLCNFQSELLVFDLNLSSLETLQTITAPHDTHVSEGKS
jgi:hypothetical protein